MKDATKIILAIVAVAGITALVLNGRQSASVINSGGHVFANGIGTAILG